MPRAGWLASGAALAALLGAFVGWQIAAAGTLTVAMATAGLHVWRRADRPQRQLGWLALGGTLVCGRLLAGLLLAPPAGAPVAFDATARMHDGVVITLYAPGNGQQRAVLALEPAGAGAHAWVTMPRYPALAPTDRVRVEGQLEPAPAAEESGFGEFLARSGIGWTMRGRTLELLPGDSTPASGLEDVRRAAAALIGEALPEPEAGLTAAMLIGLRDLVARDVAEDFRTSGLSHVVAISGFHMALLAAMAGALLRPIARRPRSLMLLAIVAGYSVLAGASPSVLRAALMCGVVVVARETGRRGQAATALALTVLLLLLVEPAAISDVGFQLSVAATAGLLRWGGPFSAALRPRLPARLPGWLVEALAISLAAQLATLPLVLFHFGRLSLVAPLANLLAAPLIAPSMIAGGAALAIGALDAAGLPQLLLAPAQTACALLVGAIVAIARLCAGLPFASVELPPPLDLVGAAAAVLLVAAMLLPRGGGRRVVADTRRPQPKAAAGRLRAAMAGTLVALALLVALVGAARPDGRLHMTVLDVGQGDAILLRGPAGSRMLVDTGPDPDRLLAELDRRLPVWDRRLDLVVITHPHEDHVAGLALLLERYDIGAIAEPGMIGLGPGDAAFRRRLAELGRTTQILAAGDRLALDGVEALVHWPLPGRVPLRPSGGGKDVNNVSIVLELRHGQRRLLLTGDVEEEIDPLLLANGIAPAGGPPIDVLKVAHHGSATASTDALLESLRPQVAVVSAGSGNPYGHPAPATVARLEAAGAQLFRTDLDGSIEIVTDGESLSVSSTGGRPTAATPRLAAPPGPGFCPIPAIGGGPYNRSRERPLASRELPAAALPRSAGLAGRAQRRRGRGRRLPGAGGGAEWAGRGPPAGRGRGAAA